MIILATFSFFYIGCDEDDPVNPPPPPGTDTFAVNYNNLLISERTIPFDQAFSGVDFFRGLILQDSNRYKDANLIDSIGLGDSSFYFRSGDLSDVSSVPGYQTRFKLISMASTQAQFDTMKTIPDSDTTLTENDFLMDNTMSFQAPLIFNSVYGFYLKGKYDSDVTPYRVFGMFFLEQAYNDTSGFKLRFDVKINKAGENRFKSQ